MDGNDDEGVLMADASVEAAGITGLAIKWASGAVNVVVVDDVEAHAIELTETAPRPLGESQRMRWRVVGSTLEVDFGSWFECFLLGRKDLEVRVPRSYANRFERVSVEGSSGSYQVRDIGCGAMKLKLASGKIDVDRVAARKLHVDVASGCVSAVGCFDEGVDVHAASGEVWVLCDGACPQSIDADIASGSVRVAVPASSGFTARITKASGAFKSGFPLERVGGAYRHGDGSARVSARLASGTFALDSVG